MTDTQTDNSDFNFTAGSLRAFMATSAEDLIRSQELRYEIFFEEMQVEASPEIKALKRDFDKYDEFCDHLLIEDTSINKIVGSYRILRRSKLPAGMKFYSAKEFALDNMLSHFKGEVMELGRACVDINYRDRSTIQLLWRAIGEYSAKYDIELMFGCGSFNGANHKDHAAALSYLYHNHLAPADFRPSAVTEAFKPINLLPMDAIDAKRTLASLPPLIKGYLRLGGFIGDGAFEDHESNTTDVCIVLKMDTLSQKYFEKFAPKS